MRFSARISTEEQKFSDSSCYEESSAFEMENIVHTIKLPPSGAGARRASSVPDQIKTKRDEPETFSDAYKIELFGEVGLDYGPLILSAIGNLKRKISATRK